MADITMCIGGNCLLKKICYRYTATPSDRQSIADYTTKMIIIDGITECPEFTFDGRNGEKDGN